MIALTSTVADNFSLTRGGLFRKLEVRLNRGAQERAFLTRRAAYAVALAWLPLLLFSLWQGLAYGGRVHVPFLRDFAAQTRFLVALPILILAEYGIDHRLRHVVGHFLKSGLVQTRELASFDAMLLGIERLRDKLWPEVLLVILAYLPSSMPQESDFFVSGVSSWHMVGTGADARLSYAGWWFLLVSVPLFRFLLLRWMWRIILWALFIWRVTHLKLHLVATHTDMAAGLGFLAEAQGRFSPIVFAGGVVVAGAVGNAIAYEGATLDSLKFVLLAYVVLALLALFAPLTLAAPKLVQIRKQALFEYGALVTAHNQAFHARWFDAESHKGEGLLAEPDPSSLADLGASFSVVRDMRPVPFDRRAFFTLSLAAALPMLPVIIIATPANEVISAVMAMLG
jgi:hypothetical protein